MFLLKTVSLFGLDAVHWFFVLIVPIIMAALGIIYLLRMRRVEHEMTDVYQDAADEIRETGKLPVSSESEAFEERLTLYREDGKALFEDRYLPDPDDYFVPAELMSRHEQRAVSYWPSALFVLLGLFGLVGAAASLTAIPPAVPAQNLPVLIFPLATGLALAAYAWFYTNGVRARLENEAKQLNNAMTARLNVFRDKAGIASLINEMQTYDRNMGSQLKVFNDTAERLATSEFSKGIEDSVRAIMTEQVSPPIQNASNALIELAGEITARQESGMADLANQFANVVGSRLAVHLAPLDGHLSAMNEKLAESERYIKSQVDVLETSRQQNIELNTQIHEAIELLTKSKEDMVKEIGDIRGHIALIGVTTEKMAALYTGEEADLAAHINQLAAQLQNYAIRLDTSVGESSKALLAAAQLAERQDEAGSIWLDRLDSQLDRLADLGRIISDNTTNFTKETADFVRKSLDEYDAGLAEVIERLTFTTTEIRDAVDALPQALRPGIG